MAARIVWWWNPLGWFVRRKLRETSELACDEWVIRLLPNQRRAYAESLIEVNERVSTIALPLPVVGARADSVRAFQRRLTMIRSDHRPGKWSTWTWPAVGVVLLLALPGFSWEKAQTPPTEAPAENRDDVAEAASTGMASTKRPNGTNPREVDVARIVKAVGDSLAVIRVQPDNPQPPTQGLGVVLNKHGLILTCQRLLDDDSHCLRSCDIRQRSAEEVAGHRGVRSDFQ